MMRELPNGALVQTSKILLVERAFHPLILKIYSEGRKDPFEVYYGSEAERDAALASFKDI